MIFALSFVIQTFLLLKNPSFWHDEAALALNITGKSFTGLLGGLDNMQAAPPAFLLISKLILTIFNPKTDYWRDFCLKIIPYTAGVLSIAGFYYFSCIFFKQKRQILFANFLFALNPCAILYSAQYKQYTCELFTAIILLIIFYKIINSTKINKFYYFVIFFAPFFSLSSPFIIFSGCLAMLFAKKIKKNLILQK